MQGNLVIDDLKVGRETAGQVELTFDSKGQACSASLQVGREAADQSAPYLHAQGRGACWFADNIRPTSTRRCRWK